MEVTPLIPDGFTGTIKKLTCYLCNETFYVPMEWYQEHHTVFCHGCSLEAKEKEDKIQLKAARVAMDTPEQANIRQIVEGERGKDYEMLYSSECAGGWETFLRRKVGKNTYEVVCDAVYPMGESHTDQAIVSSFFYYPNSKPPFTYRTHNEDDIQEFIQTVNQTYFPNQEEKLQYIRDWLAGE